VLLDEEIEALPVAGFGEGGAGAGGEKPEAGESPAHQ
jgi:hypothetical protein